jgi:hypothetical protein
MHRIALTLIILFVICTPAFAGPQVDNAEIASIFSADQADRQKQPIDWKVVAPLDAARKNRVLELIKQGKICTANDHFRAAMVFQHGDSLDDIRSAFSLAQIAALLDPSLKQARWLTAASWDRILMRKNVPQWYGTHTIDRRRLRQWGSTSRRIGSHRRRTGGAERAFLAKQRIC